MEGGSVNVSQSNESILKDEGYQSTLDFTTSKDKLAKMEGFYKQQITAMELELKLHQSCVKKYKNGLIADDGNAFEGKGKGGKRYIRKMCNPEKGLKEQYLSKIKSEKKCLKFQQLDNETQLMISKIDVFRGFSTDNDFFDELLELFEGKSMELMEMKEQECEYVKVIYDLMVQLEEKDQVINDSNDKLQAALMGKTRGGCLSELSGIKGGRKDLKIEELDEESQRMIANIEALRESDAKIYNKVLSMNKFDDDL